MKVLRCYLPIVLAVLSGAIASAQANPQALVGTKVYACQGEKMFQVPSGKPIYLSANFELTIAKLEVAPVSSTQSTITAVFHPTLNGFPDISFSRNVETRYIPSLSSDLGLLLGIPLNKQMVWELHPGSTYEDMVCIKGGLYRLNTYDDLRQYIYTEPDGSQELYYIDQSDRITHMQSFEGN